MKLHSQTEKKALCARSEALFPSLGYSCSRVETTSRALLIQKHRQRTAALSLPQQWPREEAEAGCPLYASRAASRELGRGGGDSEPGLVSVGVAAMLLRSLLGGRPLLLLRPAFLALLLVLLPGPVRPVSFQLPGKASKCLREEIHRDTLVTGEYEVAAPPGSSSGPSANLKVRAGGRALRPRSGWPGVRGGTPLFPPWLHRRGLEGRGREPGAYFPPSCLSAVRGRGAMSGGGVRASLARLAMVGPSASCATSACPGSPDKAEARKTEVNPAWARSGRQMWPRGMAGSRLAAAPRRRSGRQAPFLPP